MIDMVAIGARSESTRKMHWPASKLPRLFLVMFAVYFAAACYLDLVANVIAGDSLSHVAIAQRVLFSRDPHLAAIGFVWSPLPTLALLPLVALKTMWPQLTTLGLSAGIVSAAFMAGAVVQLSGLFREAGLSRRVVLLLTATFAFNPLVLFFGANGMTEAILLCFLLMAVRYLTRWLRDSDLNSLIATGLALSLAYFTRYEAVAAAFGVLSLVAVVSVSRSGKERAPFWSVLCDLVLVGGPFALAFVVWAIASWLITGHAFEQFASIYSNSAQLKAEGPMHPWTPALLGRVISQLRSIEPFAPVVGILVAAHVRRLGILATGSIACLGATFVFMVVAELNASIDNQLRYLIVFVPLTVTLAGAAVASTSRPRRHLQLSRLFEPQLGTVVAVGAVVCTLLALPLCARAMLEPTINGDLAIGLQSIVAPDGVNERGGHLNWATERRVAADLDRQNLPPSSVLVDDFLGFPVVVSSRNPDQFVITSDRDFQEILADPSTPGLRYILVPQPDGLGSLDAVNRQYPNIYENGGGFSTLVHEYVKQGLNDRNWRLYRIT